MKFERLLFGVLIIFVFVLFVQECSGPEPSMEKSAFSAEETDGPKQVFRPAEREFRGAWVATVANIDWPSRPGMPVDSQRIEALAILDTLAALQMNAVIFQARPQCDALYESPYEPWSYYLSGVQGQAPEPYYDPLTFWVDEAHHRGMELHVWFNPYRAHHPSGGPVSEHSLVNTQPEIVKTLLNGYHWLEPSFQKTQDWSYRIVMDVLKRYDIDGVHFDDYFYPYPSYCADGEFPDSAEYAAYLEKGGELSKGDWRRDHVNRFIERLYKGIKKEKPHVKFGISPFGIWRPGYPASIQGFDQYDVLYADVRKWFHEGWLDYLTPQLYWRINQIPQSYATLMAWWHRENKQGRHLWPGLFTSRLVFQEGGDDEVFNEIMIARAFEPDAPGHIHFSMKALLNDTLSINQTLKNGPYAREALIPEMTWAGGKIPKAPNLNSRIHEDSLLYLVWTHRKPKKIAQWVLYTQYGNAQTWQTVPAHIQNLEIPLLKYGFRTSRTDTAYIDSAGQVIMKTDTLRYPLRKLAVSAINRFRLESPLVIEEIKTDSASWLWNELNRQK
jgi:uncharacterized lipoprotein YddW (UPF0748 family)